jgi:hypothetical protein
LIETIQANDIRRCLEIGVYGGRSLLAMALAAEHVDGVDAWDAMLVANRLEEGTDRQWWINNADMIAFLQDRLEDVIKTWGLSSKIALHKCQSSRYPHNFFNIDLLHIDGDHVGAGPLGDCKRFLPAVNAGGWIFLDDINWLDRGAYTVRDALDWLRGNGCDVQGIVDECAILRLTKPPK